MKYTNLSNDMFELTKLFLVINDICKESVEGIIPKEEYKNNYMNTDYCGLVYDEITRELVWPMDPYENVYVPYSELYNLNAHVEKMDEDDTNYININICNEDSTDDQYICLDIVDGTLNWCLDEKHIRESFDKNN